MRDQMKTIFSFYDPQFVLVRAGFEASQGTFEFESI